MGKKLISRGFLVLVLLFLYVPILILAFYSFTDATMIGMTPHFSIDNYVNLISKDELREMIIGTIVLTIVVAILSTILGTMGAIGAFYSKPKTRLAMEFMNKIPVINADVVTGFSVCVLLIVFFGMDKSTYIPLVIGLTSLCTPFVYLSVMPRLKQLDGEIYEAALDLGCSPMRAMRKVVLPQLFSGIVSGFMMSVTLVLDDYFISTYTKPASFDTISTYVVNATKGAQTEIKTALWALSTVIFVIAILVVAANNIKGRKEAEA